MDLLILADDFRKRYPNLILRIDMEVVPEGTFVTFHGYDGVWCPFLIKQSDRDNLDLKYEFFIPAMRALENAQSNQFEAVDA